MKKLKMSLILLISSIVIWSLMQVTVYGGYVTNTQTNSQNITFNDGYILYGINKHIVYTNNGTVNVSNGFSLTGYQTGIAEFINNGKLTLTGNDDYIKKLTTFSIFSGCKFKNTGTMKVSGYYNFGATESFENTGKLFISNIAYASLNGLNNTGIIVYGDNVNDGIIGKLREKTTAPGRVMSQADYDNNYFPQDYTITYDLNGGNWINTPSSDISSYNDASSINYKFEIDAPFKNIARNLKKDGYTFAGWTCAEKGNELRRDSF